MREKKNARIIIKKKKKKKKTDYRAKSLLLNFGFFQSGVLKIDLISIKTVELELSMCSMGSSVYNCWDTRKT